MPGPLLLVYFMLPVVLAFLDVLAFGPIQLSSRSSHLLVTGLSQNYINIILALHAIMHPALTFVLKLRLGY